MLRNESDKMIQFLPCSQSVKMSRQRSELSQFGLYHIIFRGIGRQNIFEESIDYEKLKEY